MQRLQRVVVDMEFGIPVLHAGMRRGLRRVDGKRGVVTGGNKEGDLDCVLDMMEVLAERVVNLEVLEVWFTKEKRVRFPGVVGGGVGGGPVVGMKQYSWMEEVVFDEPGRLRGVEIPKGLPVEEWAPTWEEADRLG